MTNKSCKSPKDDSTSVESRIMTRTTRYIINEKIAIDRKIKVCNNAGFNSTGHGLWFMMRFRISTTEFLIIMNLFTTT